MGSSLVQECIQARGLQGEPQGHIQERSQVHPLDFQAEVGPGDTLAKGFQVPPFGQVLQVGQVAFALQNCQEVLQAEL